MGEVRTPLVEFDDLAVSYGLVQALAGVTGAFLAGPHRSPGAERRMQDDSAEDAARLPDTRPRAHDGLRQGPDARAARGAAAARLHAGAGLPPPRGGGRGVSGVRGRGL